MGRRPLSWRDGRAEIRAGRFGAGPLDHSPWVGAATAMDEAKPAGCQTAVASLLLWPVFRDEWPRYGSEAANMNRHIQSIGS
jgi:hypothetical protein